MLNDQMVISIGMIVVGVGGFLGITASYIYIKGYYQGVHDERRRAAFERQHISHMRRKY